MVKEGKGKGRRRGKSGEERGEGGERSVIAYLMEHILSFFPKSE